MTKIQVKRSQTGGVVPTTGDLDIAELGINTADKKMFTSNGTAIFEVGSNLSSVSVGGGKFSANTTNAYIDGVPISSGGSPGGANTQIQYNDSTTFGGSAGFTFNNTTNNVVIANTLTVGSFTANTTLVNTAAINVVNQVNTATLYATTSANVASIVQANSLGVHIAAAGDLVLTAGAGINANGSLGTATHCLHSNGTSVYWASSMPPKSLSIASPTSTEKIALFHSDAPLTVTEIRSVVSGTTPSVTFSIRYGTDYAATGTEVVTSGMTCTNTTTGNTTTSFNSASIPANNFVWLTTTAASGTIDIFHVTVKF